MKKESNILSLALTEAGLVNFTMEDSETFVLSLVNSNHKIFSTSDLWYIRRKKKQQQSGNVYNHFNQNL